MFLASRPEDIPPALLHNVKHNRVLHERIVVLTVAAQQIPYVDDRDCAEIQPLGEGFYRIIASYGFMQSPNVREVLACCEPMGSRVRPADTSFYLGREQLIPTGAAPMSRWRKSLFVFMSRNARAATEFFGLPPNRVVELGAQIEF